MNFKVYCLTIPDNNNIIKYGCCSCASFLKNHICKHILAFAVLHKQFKISNEPKNIPIGERRKRGRPALATRALLII